MRICPKCGFITWGDIGKVLRLDDCPECRDQEVRILAAKGGCVCNGPGDTAGRCMKCGNPKMASRYW